MKLNPTNYKKELISVSFAFALIISTITIINFVPTVSGLTLNTSIVCSGWTSDEQPVAASNFLSGQTVFLYYSTSDNQGYSATLQFRLTDPNGLVWNSYESREEYNSHTETYNSASSSQTTQTSFLKVLDVTSDIPIGTWQITGYYGDTQLFQQTFSVAAGQAAPTITVTIPNPTEATTNTPTSMDIGANLFFGIMVIFIILVLAIIIVVFKRMDQKHKKAA
jgi:hypothetical protein